jgi:hypothetical protein
VIRICFGYSLSNPFQMDIFVNRKCDDGVNPTPSGVPGQGSNIDQAVPGSIKLYGFAVMWTNNIMR